MSAEPSALLEAAYTIVAEQLARLRVLLDAVQQRSATMANEVRQSARLLDEATTQSRFSRERKLPTAALAAKREQQQRQSHDILLHEHEELQRVWRQLDQLMRQIDMSSTTLSGGEGEQNDPWVQALRSQIIMGREQERMRLAREVHDGPAQVLANSLMGLEHARTLLAQQRTERLESLLEQMRDNAHEGLHEVRQFIADLRPGKFGEQGLTAALYDYVERYRNTINDQVHFEVETLPRLNTEIEIVLYRIVQESLQNAHKHARGAAVFVEIVLRKETLVLKVHDNGPGFDPRIVARRTGRESWGLMSMRERAELIGAEFVVSSRPGHGTDVSVVLPLRST